MIEYSNKNIYLKPRLKHTVDHKPCVKTYNEAK